MSKYIQIPNKIQEITGRAKLKEIYAYGLIRSQIRDNTYRVSLPQKELAEMGGWDEKTSYNYVNGLITTGLIKDDGKGKGKVSGYLYNYYKLGRLTKDYSIYKPEFFTDPNLTSEQKGLIMLLKSHCYPGTKHMDYPSDVAASKKLKMDRERLARMIHELIAIKQVRMIGRTLVIMNDNIWLFVDGEDYKNWTYSIIYHYCLYKGVVPPVKSPTESKNLGFIVVQYCEPVLLLKALFKRFPSLPENVSLSYFAQGLRGMHYIDKPQETHQFIL